MKNLFLPWHQHLYKPVCCVFFSFILESINDCHFFNKLAQMVCVIFLIWLNLWASVMGIMIGCHNCVFNSLSLHLLFITSWIYRKLLLLHQNCLLVSFGLPFQSDLYFFSLLILTLIHPSFGLFAIKLWTYMLIATDYHLFCNHETTLVVIISI